MKSFAVICKMELRLFLRDFFGVFFTLVFPVLMLLLFGGIYGNEPIYDGSTLRFMDLCVPAYAVMIMGVTGFLSLPLTLAGCKERKIYKRFDATPAGKERIILAQVLINLVMTLAGMALLLLAGRLLYRIQIRGSFLPICVSILISIGAMFSMGFLLTAIGRDLKTTNLLCFLFYFIMLFLSGATLPDQLFGAAIKRISGFLPMTYAVDLMQGVFAGDRLLSHGRELIILGLTAVGCTAVGAVLYRRKDWT